MITGLSGRTALARVRTEGVKVGRGPMRVQYRPSTDPGSRVAFAISRHVGTAVERNRIRRRIRAILQELERDEVLPPGDLLVRVTAPLEGWSYGELRTKMSDLLVPLVTR